MSISLKQEAIDEPLELIILDLNLPNATSRIEIRMGVELRHQVKRTLNQAHGCVRMDSRRYARD